MDNNVSGRARNLVNNLQNNLANFSGNVGANIPPPFTSGEEFLTNNFNYNLNNNVRGNFPPATRRYSAEQWSRIFNENARRLRREKLENFKSKQQSYRVPMKGPQKLRYDIVDPLERIYKNLKNETAYLPNIRPNLIRRRTVRPSPLSKNARKSVRRNRTKKNNNRR